METVNFGNAKVAVGVIVAVGVMVGVSVIVGVIVGAGVAVVVGVGRGVAVSAGCVLLGNGSVGEGVGVGCETRGRQAVIIPVNRKTADKKIFRFRVTIYTNMSIVDLFHTFNSEHS